MPGLYAHMDVARIALSTLSANAGAAPLFAGGVDGQIQWRASRCRLVIDQHLPPVPQAHGVNSRIRIRQRCCLHSAPAQAAVKRVRLTHPSNVICRSSVQPDVMMSQVEQGRLNNPVRFARCERQAGQGRRCSDRSNACPRLAIVHTAFNPRGPCPVALNRRSA